MFLLYTTISVYMFRKHTHTTNVMYEHLYVSLITAIFFVFTFTLVMLSAKTTW